LICASCKSSLPKEEQVEVSETVMKQVLSSEMWNSYQNKTFNLFIDTNTKEYQHCPTADCKNIIQIQLEK